MRQPHPRPNKVMIRGSRADFDSNRHLSFMVETASGRCSSEIVLTDENSYSLPLQIKEVTRGKYMAFQRKDSGTVCLQANHKEIHRWKKG